MSSIAFPTYFSLHATCCLRRNPRIVCQCPLTLLLFKDSGCLLKCRFWSARFSLWHQMSVCLPFCPRRLQTRMSLENCSCVRWELQDPLPGLAMGHVQAQTNSTEIHHLSHKCENYLLFKMWLYCHNLLILPHCQSTVPQCIPVQGEEKTGLWCAIWHISNSILGIWSAEGNTTSVAVLHTLLQPLLLSPNLKPLMGFQGKALHLKHSSRAEQWSCSTRCLAQGVGNNLWLQKSDAEPLYHRELQPWKHQSTRHLHLPGGWQGAKFGKDHIILYWAVLFTDVTLVELLLICSVWSYMF